MKINGEEVELVTSFETLRVGMIVWETDCDDCGGRHRFLVLGMQFDEFEDTSTGLKERGVRWELSYDPHGGEDVFIDQWALDSGTFFRVIDPLLDAKPVTRAKELAR
jgi:hypothetical protein